MFPDMHAKCFYLKDAIIWSLGASLPFNIEKNIIIIVTDKPLNLMRPILMAVLLLPATIFSQSKKDNIVFGKVSKEELLATTCDFDKDAKAAALLHSGRM